MREWRTIRKEIYAALSNYDCSVSYIIINQLVMVNVVILKSILMMNLTKIG